MNKWNLEYYFVPEEFITFDKKQQQLISVDLNGWQQVNIGEARGENTSKIFKGFFVEDQDFISNLIWQFKSEDEELTIRLCESKRKNIFRDRIIQEKLDIAEEVPECFGGMGIFIFKRNESVTKLFYIDPGEMLACYFRPECMSEIINEISFIAEKTEYSKYELDEL